MRAPVGEPRDGEGGEPAQRLLDVERGGQGRARLGEELQLLLAPPLGRDVLDERHEPVHRARARAERHELGPHPPRPGGVRHHEARTSRLRRPAPAPRARARFAYPSGPMTSGSECPMSVSGERANQVR